MTDGGALPPLDELRERAPQACTGRRTSSSTSGGRWARCSSTTRAKFVDGWAALSPAVQVRVLKPCAKERHRLLDSRLVALLEAALEARRHRQDAARVARSASASPKTGGGRAAGGADGAAEVVAVAVLAVGERRLTEAQPLLAQLLESSQPRVRRRRRRAPPTGLGVGLASSRPPRTKCLSRWRSRARQLQTGAAPDAHCAMRRRAPAPPRRRCPDALRGGGGGTSRVGAPDRRRRRRRRRGGARRRRRRHADAAAHRTRRRRACGGGARGGRRRRVLKDDATAGGDDRGRGEPIQGVHCALEVLRWLPEEMVPADSLPMLLRHPRGVREAALPLLRPSLCASPRLRDLVDALALSTTRPPHAALSPRALCAGGGALPRSPPRAPWRSCAPATAPPPPLRPHERLLRRRRGGRRAVEGGGGGVGGGTPLASSASGCSAFWSSRSQTSGSRLRRRRRYAPTTPRALRRDARVTRARSSTLC